MCDAIVNYEDMSEEGQRIVDAGNTIAGTFPTGLSREELAAWIEKRFGRDAPPPTVTPEDVLHALDTAHENPSMEVNADTVEQELHDFLFPPSKRVAAPAPSKEKE